ncbi:MAG: hypothetical protein M4579_001961 [Chaenotheca gracillima]|nr:MAG: hypothetical protein M4579_001961 [Chaenotheca gracillima]
MDTHPRASAAFWFNTPPAQQHPQRPAHASHLVNTSTDATPMSPQQTPQFPTMQQPQLPPRYSPEIITPSPSSELPRAPDNMISPERPILPPYRTPQPASTSTTYNEHPIPVPPSADPYITPNTRDLSSLASSELNRALLPVRPDSQVYGNNPDSRARAASHDPRQNAIHPTPLHHLPQQPPQTSLSVPGDALYRPENSMSGRSSLAGSPPNIYGACTFGFLPNHDELAQGMVAPANACVTALPSGIAGSLTAFDVSGPHNTAPGQYTPSLVDRQMPPPSSPQQHPTSQQYATPLSRGPPPVPSPTRAFSSGRDLPSLPTTQRPNSSMSISSMLGTEPHQHSRETLSPVPQFGRGKQAVPSHSPPLNPSHGSTFGHGSFESRRPEYSPYSRPRTPEQQPQSQLQGPRGNRAHSDGSQPPYYHRSPEQNRSNPFPATSSRPNHVESPQPYYDPSRSNRTDLSPHATSFSQGGVPPRPYSQPAVYGAGASGSQEGRSASASLEQSQDHDNRPHVDFDRERSNQGYQQPPPVHDRASRGFEPNIYNDAPRRQDQQPMYHHPPVIGRREESGPQGWRPTTKEEYPGSPARFSAPPPKSLSEEGRHDAGPPETARSSFGSQGPRESGPRLSIDHAGSPPQQYQSNQNQASPTSAGPVYGNGADRRRQNLPHTPDPFGRASPFGYRQDAQSPFRKSSDESPTTYPQARGLLGINAEINRKGGRLSPLPQAVQGAQSERAAPGGEPGIKREFDRMFSGIGSGVGSAMTTASPGPNGPQAGAASGPPPKREENGEPVVEPAASADPEVVKGARSGARPGRRSKKVKEEEERKNEEENGDGRAGPGTSGSRGTKRNRHGHHHHHHQHPHHHHHHHAKPDEDHGPSPPNQQRINHLAQPDPRNNVVMTSPGIQAPGTPTPHHHHHHHHHHQATKAPSVKPSKPPAPIRIPTTTVVSNPVVASVSHLPRNHLGSTLYSSRVHIAPAAEQSKRGFVTDPLPLPRFEGQENCTLTVRIPSQFLTTKSRQEIVRRHAVWGSDIFTDDSDVLAAAIHSGWVRGAWDSDIDASLLFDLRINDSLSPAKKPETAGLADKASTKSTSSSSETFTSPPSSGPASPPSGKDLHITLLILPALEGYASTVSHGIRSRQWGDNHDGLSFQILKMQWVKGGSGSLEERSGEARRKRLRGMFDLKEQENNVISREAWRGRLKGAAALAKAVDVPAAKDTNAGRKTGDGISAMWRIEAVA